MKILFSGICGFAGSSLAAGLRSLDSTLEITGFDNFIRRGSKTNRLRLRRLGIHGQHADVRSTSDMATLPGSHWALAPPATLARHLPPTRRP